MMRLPLENSRGYTLVELMLILLVVSIIVSTGAWTMQSMLGGLRVHGAARNLVLHVRQAAAIAARTNAPVDLVFTNDGDGCVPRYEMRGAAGEVYQSVCLPTEYPGIGLGGGPPSELQCTTALTLIPKCSLCADEQTIRILPSGETIASATGVTGDSVVFSLGDDASASRIMAVAVYNTSGKVRVFRPNTDNTGWECP